MIDELDAGVDAAGTGVEDVEEAEDDEADPDGDAEEFEGRVGGGVLEEARVKGGHCWVCSFFFLFPKVKRGEEGKDGKGCGM